MEKLNVLLVDDHAVVRDGLKRIVESSGKWQCQEAPDGDCALQWLSSQRMDAVLLDLNLGEQDGLSVLHLIHHRFPRLPVLILSMLSEERYAARVLRMGAAGFLSKSQSSQEILNALDNAVRGFRSSEKALPALASHQDLTHREFQILRLLGAGKGQTEIADLLELSVKTVATHRTNLMKKMGFSNNADIIRYALEEGLLQ